MICVGVTDSVTAGVILCDSVTTGDLVDDNVTAAVSEGVFVTAGVIAFDKETTGVKVEDGVAKAVGVMEGVTICERVLVCVDVGVLDAEIEIAGVNDDEAVSGAADGKEAAG